MSLGPYVLGRFVVGRFVPWDVLSWDVLSVHPKFDLARSGERVMFHELILFVYSTRSTGSQ